MEEAKLEILDAISALVVILDAEGRIEHWNRASSELTGYALDEVRRRFVWEFLLVSDEAEAVRSEFARIKAKQGASEFENYWVTKDGRRRWLRWSNVAAHGPGGRVDRIVATGIDRTEGKHAEEALRLSEAKTRGILSIAADAVVTVDGDQRIVTYNEGAERLFGWSRDEALGKPLDILIPERLRAAHREHILDFERDPETARRMGARQPELVGLRKNGEEFPAEAAFSKLRSSDGWLFTAVFRDVSERKALEMHLRHEIRARDDLTHTVVHDLRNPLNSISLQTQALLQLPDPHQGRATAALERIRRWAERMARLLDDLLDSTRVRAGQLSVERSQLLLAELLEEAVEAARPPASAKGISLHIEIDGDLPPLDADRIRILQVLDNLIGNAIKFSPTGGSVTVTAGDQEDGLQVRISDTGPGLLEEQIEHVFELFWQAKHGDRRGAGLGLAIAKGIVEAHGGRIWVESTPGSGSTFVLTLPKGPRDRG